MPPNDLATELNTGEVELAINGPNLDEDYWAYDEYQDNQL